MLLAIDTATRTVGIALHDGAQVLAERTWHSNQHQTVELAPQAGLMLRQASVSASLLSGVAVAIGPGSFTGLRIGLAFAKGMALAHSLKLIGVPTLDIVAHSLPEMETPLVGVIPAGRGRLAALWYKWSRNKWKADGELTNLTVEELATNVKEASYICGELTTQQRESLRKEQLVQLAPPSACVRRPAILAEMAWDMLRRKRVKKFAEVIPIYLETK